MPLGFENFPVLPRALIVLVFLAWGAVTLTLFVASTYYLWILEPDRGLGFGYMALALLSMMVGGWKIRWLQKLGKLGPAPQA